MRKQRLYAGAHNLWSHQVVRCDSKSNFEQHKVRIGFVKKFVFFLNKMNFSKVILKWTKTANRNNSLFGFMAYQFFKSLNSEVSLSLFAAGQAFM